ncbi:2-succinyl-5-enolpyruvyl-6-hydroxy-3-cyclohexene-1-carboxylic-acid synthase [Mycobacterium ulcerans]|uniref:2-succinyl-5-enolpyruvyl-6-hydroxy-3-cyclohexene-1-carboxylate synthase n=1 Tax=Mycobacterium ulcerans (strain Agy99) TaxID=362242 RepID=MEND_MYCUA|nr:2-succinyl-5-enolpyruvyl-6-hydroxy-3-cyclohexene-1-carboxylic-acid synthase [Mycobacterium ulcerans]A0PLU9.1 RecName: Full=2-succinyl-5-enolpyruvyl-6-hydroxy-3-cyclohexene-1-carboxylate synthase; Short=SEPHCHC synthase; AltName: Full=Menaquinone biosynthesis protein MenD [Mycobacterium ulcerans Agy99]ABL03318.1 bifunctional 2-succinyl-6-hydroxy-2,4- cyclohexadiene-1-carboxylate synthase, MenD [Mycobacterium ulcerans Agy99]MEB3904432.1 2-succinyl-5-enolpyruvyl-6-hydroxy-3-cyclohexene-1-carboxy
MNPSTTQARVVVDELIRGGVRDVVLCPGSRNAPLAFALQDADRSGRIRLHVRIDERTAGFLAIGLAVGAGAPACVAMTSGTAVANLGPAVVETNYARVPLIVLSANRPYELLGTGANQTMEQLGYFGTQVRATISLGLAEDAHERLDSLNASWRSATCRMLAAAMGSRTANAGPVHFDIPLREPLVPDPDPHGAVTPPGRPEGRPWTYTPPVTFDQPLEIDLSADTVVIAGHGAGVHPNLVQLPTIAEPTAPAAPSGGNPLHPLALPLLRPRQVIMLGRPTLHRPVSALLADPEVPVFALTTGPRWPDVSGNSQATGTRAIVTGTPNPSWLDRCAQMNRHAVAAVREQLAAHPLTTGLHVAAAVAGALRPGDQLVLGASNPVRDAALVGLDTAGLRVRSNRGVAGIDGTVSTAIGAALGYERDHHGRTVALIGDLTFVHDSSGLLIGPTEPTPRQLTIVVSNDNGGGIFELLEQGDPRFSDVSSRIFGTPHDVDVGALCRAYHVENRQIEVDQLPAALDEPGSGLRVLEVKADRSSLRQLHAAIKAAL